ncbi:MAG: hypothetical protein Q8K98_10865 [Bacteroidota bacterium]|nr:hypothetical protein [Bacteroidota bacterium]
MGDHVIPEEIENQLLQMSVEQQRQVLEFIRTLALCKQTGVAGKSLLSFTGKISPDELELIQQAIEEGCEKVIADEW